MKPTFSFSLACFIILKCVSSTPLEERGSCVKDNLLNALVNRIPDSYQFCSAYISVPGTSTLTIYTSTCTLSSYIQVPTIIHPLNLYNIQPQPYGLTASPLSYNTAAPTPITIPGGPQRYVAPGAPRVKRDEVLPEAITPKELLRRATPTLPSYLATTYPPSRISSACSCLSVPAATISTVYKVSLTTTFTTTCTSYIATTVASYPAHCAPSLQVNAPYPAAHASYAVVPDFPVASKMDCCLACSSVFNCVWWKFVFGPSTPNNGWLPGVCHYAYFIGQKGGDQSMSQFGQPATCPNGMTRAIDNPDFSHIGQSENVNKAGYNFGQCGGGLNVYESAQDWGYPDDYYLHTCGGGNGEPSSNPPGCAST